MEPRHAARENRPALNALWRKATEYFGLSATHPVCQRIQHLSEHWNDAIYASVLLAFENLYAVRNALPRVGDRIPPPDTFGDGDIFLGETPALLSPPTPVYAKSSRFPLHWLVVGLSGAGKTTFVRRIVREVVATLSSIPILVFDPSRSYESTCLNPAIWCNMRWNELRLNPLCAPPGHSYETWRTGTAETLGRGELLHGRYLIDRRLERLFNATSVPALDDGKCPVPSLPDLCDDLSRYKERPGTPDEKYRCSALNVASGRVRSTGDVYHCARGMEDIITGTRARIDMYGLSPQESAEFLMSTLIRYQYARRLMEPMCEPPMLRALVGAEDAQLFVGRRPNEPIAPYLELLLKSRAIGLGFIFVAHNLSDIDEVVLSAISNYAVFAQSSVTNTRIAKDLLNLSTRESEMFGNLPPGQCFLRMVGDSWPHPFLLQVAP